MLRLVRGVTRKDQVGNVNNSEDLGVRAMLDEGDTARLRLQKFGHMKRMRTFKQGNLWNGYHEENGQEEGREWDGWMLRRKTSSGEREH